MTFKFCQTALHNWNYNLNILIIFKFFQTVWILYFCFFKSWIKISKALQMTEFSKFCTFAKIGITLFSKFRIFLGKYSLFCFLKFFGNKYKNASMKIYLEMNWICVSNMKLPIKTMYHLILNESIHFKYVLYANGENNENDYNKLTFQIFRDL